MKYYIVDDSRIDWRLDKFLAEKTGQTRSQIKKSIERGFVLINDKPAKVHQFLRLKDKVTLIEQEDNKTINQENTLNIKKSKIEKVKNKIFSKKEKLPKELEPKILHKEKDFIVIEKPCGILVHKTKTSTDPTIVDWLIKKFPQVSKIADAKSLLKRDLTFRPGIVHRLDRDVSGVMLIALNQTAYEYFKDQFQKRKVTKKYIALIHGQLAKNEGEIEFRISRSTKGGKMAAHPVDSDKGKPSLTKFDVIEKFPKFTKVEIELMTGRTNQIRVHFFALGHPIVGDTLYKLKEKTKLKSDRILLHAQELSFINLDGKKQTFTSKLPDEFNL